MEDGLHSVYVKPKEWQEWVIGTFDPTFEQPARFFLGWDMKDQRQMMALMAHQETGYDKAMRMSADEADNEILLIQACVGANVYVYKIPYLPPSAKSLSDITQKATKNDVSSIELYKPLPLRSTLTKHLRFIDNSGMFVLALCFATLIASVVFS